MKDIASRTLAQAVVDVNRLRVVDLSKMLDPATERRRCALRRYFTVVNETSGYHCEIDIMSHLGTHLEFPFHVKDEWKDGSQLPPSAFVARGILLHLATVRPKELIRRTDLEDAARGRVQPGDAVLLDSPYHSEPFMPSPHDQRPQLSEEAARWFRDQQVKCVGWGDGVAIENNGPECRAFHEILLGHEVLLLEVVKNLEHLRDETFLLVYAPLPIVGLDSCPVRVLAIEGLPLKA